jgi:hypothetical protein
METPPKSPSPGSRSPSSSGVSWRSVWAQRLSWLISALSGTLEIEHRTRDLRKENDRLAELESKIDGLFSKYGINSKTPDQSV